MHSNTSGASEEFECVRSPCSSDISSGPDAIREEPIILNDCHLREFIMKSKFSKADCIKDERESSPVSPKQKPIHLQLNRRVYLPEEVENNERLKHSQSKFEERCIPKKSQPCRDGAIIHRCPSPDDSEITSNNSQLRSSRLESAKRLERNIPRCSKYFSERVSRPLSLYQEISHSRNRDRNENVRNRCSLKSSVFPEQVFYTYEEQSVSSSFNISTNNDLVSARCLDKHKIESETSKNEYLMSSDVYNEQNKDYLRVEHSPYHLTKSNQEMSINHTGSHLINEKEYVVPNMKEKMNFVSSESNQSCFENNLNNSKLHSKSTSNLTLRLRKATTLVRKELRKTLKSWSVINSPPTLAEDQNITDKKVDFTGSDLIQTNKSSLNSDHLSKTKSLYDITGVTLPDSTAKSSDLMLSRSNSVLSLPLNEVSSVSANSIDADDDTLQKEGQNDLSGVKEEFISNESSSTTDNEDLKDINISFIPFEGPTTHGQLDDAHNNNKPHPEYQTPPPIQDSDHRGYELADKAEKAYNRRSLSRSEWDIHRSTCRLSDASDIQSPEMSDMCHNKTCHSTSCVTSTAGNTNEGKFQKFRKSLSLRLAKKISGPQKDSNFRPPLPPEGVPEEPSQGLYTEYEGGLVPPSSPHPDDHKTYFMFGHPFFRSSKERRKARQKSDIRAVKCGSGDSADSGIEVASGGSTLVRSHNACPRDSTEFYEDGGLQDLEYHLSNDATHELQDIDEERSCLRRTRSEMVRSRSTSQSLSTHPKFCFGRQFSTPQPMKMKHVYAMPEYSVQPMDGNLTMKRSKGSAHLRRSVSQPLDLDKSFNAQVSVRSRMATRMTADRKKQRRPSMGNLLSEDESSADEEPAGYDTDDPDLDGEVSVEHRREYKPGQDEATGIVFAEALWDHVSLDAEELVFKAGDLITVVDYSDPNWWWGKVTYRSGWFPASFVRLLVNQEDHEAATEALVPEEHTEVGEERWSSPRKASVASMSHERVRANVIVEIIATERDYVKHLNDLAEGYLKQMRRRPDMFTSESIATIFGNVETLFAFHVRFLAELESCIEYENPHNSCIGRCFIENKTNFEIYSDYCNNHPSAVLQLQEMFQQQKYVHFFEACRLLQEMIDISLDGFLLTPVQKICKYPLQLQELLKYTSPKHHDYAYVHGALQAMKEVATLVNERRRRTESLEKIAKWQREVEGWVGPDLLEVSSQLIHQGEATKGIGGSWPKEVIMFLFDHQLIYCKKDLLKRRTFVYRGRINTDLCEVADIHDEAARVAGVQHAWKIHCLDKSKTYVFTCKSAEEKEKWLQAFRRERTLVALDEASGYVASELQKDVARLAAKNQRLRPKKPRVKRRTRKTMTYAQARRLVSAERPRLNGVDGVSGDKRPPDSDSVAPEMTKKKSHHWFIFGGSRKTRAESHGRAAP